MGPGLVLLFPLACCGSQAPPIYFSRLAKPLTTSLD